MSGEVFAEAGEDETEVSACLAGVAGEAVELGDDPWFADDGQADLEDIDLH